MRILYVVNHIDWFWSHRFPLAKAAYDAGYDVHVAVHGAESDERLAEHGFTGHELPPSNPLRIAARLHRIVKRENPNVVHAITLKYAFFAALAAVLHRRPRMIHTIAGLGYLFSSEGMKPKAMRLLLGPLLKFLFKNKRTTLVFQNPDDRRIFLARGFARRTQCVLIRGSGVDLLQFPYVEKQADDAPLAIMPTRLVHDKGVATFIEAARILLARGVKARFQIAGALTRHNPKAISQAEINEMIAGSPVEWLGKVADMPALYADSTLVVYPSYYGEGVPKVLLEAASTGRPIVTSDHPGCREAVADGVNGLLAPVKNAQATADAIESLLGDAARRQIMGLAGRQRAEKEFDVKIIVARTLKVYHGADETPRRVDREEPRPARRAA